MPLLVTLHRWWLNRCLASVTLRAAAERDELEYLEEVYHDDPYNQARHDDILHSRAYIRALETEQDRVNSSLRALEESAKVGS